VANELSDLNQEPIRHISSLENPEEHPDPLLARRESLASKSTSDAEAGSAAFLTTPC